MIRGSMWACTGVLGLILGLWLYIRAQRRKNVEYIVLKRQPTDQVSGSLFIRADLESSVAH